jgi:hypothetical protein
VKHNVIMVWNLIRNASDDFIPDQIFRTIKYAKYFELKKAEHLPHFLDFKRSNAFVFLEVSTLSQELRSIIGSR